MKRLILAAAAFAALGTAAHAQEIVRGGAPTSPIASVVTVPAGYDTIYVSGMTPPMLDPKGDPAKGGKMDFAGMMESYKTFFGTPEQPNKPSRITSQVASLVQPGMLVEIEVQAARKPK